MRLVKYIIIFILFIGISCQDVNYMDKPKNLIPEDKMVDILTEMALVNAARNYNKIMLEQTGIDPDQYIYDKFGIDSVQFEKSNAYYTEKYDDYERVFDKVKDSLESLKTHFDELVEEEKRVEDSINKAKEEKRRVIDSINKANQGKNRPKFDSTKVDPNWKNRVVTEVESGINSDTLKQKQKGNTFLKKAN